MPRRLIGHGWSLDLDPSFRERADDGQNVFWSADGKTVYAVVYNSPGADAEGALAEMVRDRGVKPAHRYERADGAVAGEAWLIPEEQGGNQYWGLNTFTTAPTGGSVACVTFYFQHKSDVDWARSTWSTVRPTTTSVGQRVQ
jgi:hypothetical protein